MNLYMLHELSQSSLIPICENIKKKYLDKTPEYFVDSYDTLYGNKTYKDLFNEGYEKFKSLLDKEGKFVYHGFVFDIWEERSPAGDI